MGLRFEGKGFLALQGGVGGVSLLGEGVGEGAMGVGIVGVGGDGLAELDERFSDFALLEELGSAVEIEFGTLAADGHTAEVSRFFAFGGGSGGVSLRGEDGAEVDVRAGLVGLELDGATEGGDGLVGLVHLLVDAAEDGPGVTVVFGAHGKGLLELAGGVGEAAQLHIYDAEGEGRVGEAGIELGGLLESGDGFGDFVLELEGEAEVVVELGVVGFEGQAGAELLDGVVEVGLLEPGDACVLVEDGVFRVELKGALVHGEAGFGVSGLDEGEAEVGEGG